MIRERRFLTGNVEIRSAANDPDGDGDNDAGLIVGYAAVFNSPANIAGMFVEQIAPGAFAAAIGRDDVRALFNHDENLILGRTAAKTLTLAEDARGLVYEITPPDTTTARDLAVSIGRGDVSQSSFSFRAVREEWDESGDIPKRTILEAELYDVSPVTFPAYDDTEVACRSLAASREARAKQDEAPAAADAAALKRRMEVDLRALPRSRSA